MFDSNVKWDEVKNDLSYTFECPITGAHIGTQEFGEIYGKFLETLNGKDPDGIPDAESYVSEFFEISPVNHFHWGFRDNAAKVDFYDLCNEMGLMPEIGTIRDGTFAEKPKKKPLTEKEIEARNKQREQMLEKRKLSENDKESKIRASRLASLAKLKEQIQKEQDNKKKAKLETKIQKIQAQLGQSR